MPTPIVAYYRVSTQKQGRSGLGLEAQRKAVAAYAASQGAVIMDEFTEIETGKGADALERRPLFAQALRKAKKLGAPIVVAKLDRLSRDVAFIATLMAKKVEFVTADDPTKSPFMLHIKAAMAEEERRQISDRTGTPFMAMFLHCCPVQRAITVHLRLLRWPGWKADLTLAARHAALPDPAVLPPISNPPSQGL